MEITPEVGAILLVHLALNEVFQSKEKKLWFCFIFVFRSQRLDAHTPDGSITSYNLGTSNFCASAVVKSSESMMLVYYQLILSCKLSKHGSRFHLHRLKSEE